MNNYIIDLSLISFTPNKPKSASLSKCICNRVIKLLEKQYTSQIKVFKEIDNIKEKKKEI